MFLKRLELIGFKSFADKIGIDFVPGVTAVVGPNGSGKSNVTDAIRWVLGEQSAKSLRGSKMEDVIFAGSDSRKPLNFAEVTLVLDNTDGLFPLDYTEVSVSRRVFRSGDSAYLLNGQPCRLKDINDAFIDSGVGKEAFSIISQGRIDEILNSRPEDRRTIFDEAAGVLKYKNRKKKAEHKLFETEDNLDRVLDILKELDMRMEPLEKSAKDAQLYNELTEEIRDADVQLLNFDAMHYDELIVNAAQEAQQLQQQKEQVQKELRSSEKQLDIYNKISAEADAETERQAEAYRIASAELEKWEGRRLLSLEQKKNTAQQLKRLQNEYEQTDRERLKIKEEMAPAAAAASKIEKEFEETEVELSSIAQLLSKSAAETEQEIDELKSIYIDLLNEEATQRNEIKHINERLEGEKVSAEKMNQQTAAIQKILREFETEKAALAEKTNAYKMQTAETNEQYESGLKAVKVIEKQLAEQQQFLQKGLNRQHEMKGRLRALESMESDLTGFFSGVKEVLLAKRAQKLHGIDGAVTELITVDNMYVKAIETALGGAAQHVITATEIDARNAIAYLKSKNAGRATFLPRNVLKPRMIPAGLLSAVLRHPEYISTADQLVQTADEFRVITGNLLGGTIVAKTLAGASAIAKLMSYKYRIVTLDGDVVNAGGSLTGGGVKNQSSVFTRKAELENLKLQLGKMEASIEIAEKKVNEMKLDVYTQSQHAEQSRQSLARQQKEAAEIQTAIREIEISIQSLKKELASIEAGQAGTQNSGRALKEKQEAIVSNHERIKKELDRIQREIQSLERLAANRRTEESSLLKKQSELREHAAVLRVQKKHQQAAIQNLQERLQDAEEKLTMLHGEIQIFQGTEEGKEFTAEEILMNIERLALTKKELEDSLSVIKTKRLHCAEQLAEVTDRLQKQRLQSAETTEALHSINVSLSRLQSKYESIAERLLEEYGLYPDGEKTEDFDVDLIRSKVEKLKNEAEQLGPINQSAIAEFHEVSERHRFLSDQRNDLIEAKNTLNDAMCEMDREMKSRFSSTFKAVQSRFSLVFKEMFGGGEADLLLTNPDDLLETGVDIVARPPGKKLQNLSLLSGGERALTAIVLLFSIIEVRPVPFCILDEVEAALDEANVVRYSKYLKKSSRNTQFIVITHRKGTMEGADVLYGITMQESGVSKLISVKLSEVAEEAIT